MSAQRPANVAHPNGLPAKKRTLRKGTYSCWECKHRKRRCEFKPASSTICVTCQRLGLPCLSQEFADPSEGGGYDQVSRHIDRVEDLVERLLRHKGTPRPPICGDAMTPWPGTLISHGPLTGPFNTSMPSFDVLPNRQNISSMPQQPSQDWNSTWQTLSNYLCMNLPNPNLANTITTRGKSLFEIMPDVPSMARCHSSGDVIIAPASGQTTVVARLLQLARRLIQLGLCLQQLNIKTLDQTDLNLDESLIKKAWRYMQTASQVTSQDCMMKSLEGIEILMMEACFKFMAADLDAACMTIRRAVGIAHLLRLPQRVAGKVGTRAEFVWLRMMYVDRYGALMNGMPSNIDNSQFTENQAVASNAPSEKLERAQVAIAGKIISRNMRIINGQYAKQVYEDTLAIDDDLKLAARNLPVEWWGLPTVLETASHQEKAEDNVRLVTQMHQSYLVILIHLPFLLHAFEAGLDEKEEDGIDYSYSKIATVSASREVLSRYILIRRINFIGSSLPGIDHKSFLAASTLLLAHVVAHRHGKKNVLEHQRPHDLKAIKSATAALEPSFHFARFSCDEQYAMTLKRLFEIEADAAKGIIHAMEILGEESSMEPSQLSALVQNHHSSTAFWIPYSGIVRVFREQSEDTTDLESTPSGSEALDSVPTPHMSNLSLELNHKEEWENLILDQDFFDSWLSENDETTGRLPTG